MRLSSEQSEACRALLERHARTFAFAARFLAREQAEHAAAVYAWCRCVDDAIDLAPHSEHADRLARLRAELDQVFGEEQPSAPVLAAFRTVVQARGIRRRYCEELLRGMAMDAEDARYETFDDLLLYAYRVAGVVGLMMAHVLGVRDEDALPAAARLGMAMQLTNICRDVAEDHARGRCYLPEELLGASAAASIRAALGRPFPRDARAAAARARRALLEEAERLYIAADVGLAALDARSALAIGIARRGYAEIGREVERMGLESLEARAFVPSSRKAVIALREVVRSVAGAPRRLNRSFHPIVPGKELEYADVLPIA